MVQYKKNIIGIVATIIGVFSLFLSLLVTVFSFVDPVGLMYAYFAIPFVLFSLVFSNRGWLITKLFAILFILSHCVAFWTIRDIEEKSNVVKYSKSFNEDTFIKCSETMFKGMNGNQKQLTSKQQSNFDNCLNKQQ
jgi:predicted membrane protein